MEISSAVFISSSWVMAQCWWRSLRTFSALRKENSASSRVEKSQGHIVFFFKFSYPCSIPYIGVKNIIARIFGCKQGSSSLCEVYAQETRENLVLFTLVGGDGGADSQQLSGWGRVLLGLESPAWGNSMLHLNLNIILTSLQVNNHFNSWL